MAARDDDETPAAERPKHGKVDTEEEEDEEEEEEEEADEAAPREAVVRAAVVSPEGIGSTYAAAKLVGNSGILDSKWRFVLLIPVLVVVWLALAESRKNAKLTDLAPDSDTIAAHPLQDADEAAFADAIAKAWAGEAVDREALPARLQEPGQPVYIAFRENGIRLYDLWRTPADVASANSMWDVVAQAIADGRRGLGDKASRINRIEIDLTHSYRTHDYKDEVQRKLLLDEDRHKVPAHFGVRGLQVTHGDNVKRLSPTWFISKNRKIPKHLKEIRNDWKLTEEEFAASTFQTFEADQVLVRLDRTPAEAVVMFRGNEVVDISEVTQQSTDALATGMLNWLVNNVHEDGRLTYHYFPTPAEEEKSNNMIRQWMATNAMVRWAHDRKDQAVFDVAERNIDYNLANFFYYERDGQKVSFYEGEPVPDDVLGVIDYEGKVKLGSIGLAGMAMWLHPKRDKWMDEILALDRMCTHLWHEDGSFTSFYRGSDKEFHNFYPGEAMLFWATMYADTKDPEILRKFKLSFEYYRKWHLEKDNRNPAFVPWHLQADYAMWQALGEDEQAFKDEMVEFMFEIATWLVENMQQWENGEWTYPDERGRFYAPNEGWGVPHASSTGVYIEGLIDAWQLARDVGDSERREYYRLALLRGIREMMQLQFVDDVDMFYVRDRKYVEGGIRTTLFDNRIRCDNVQHPMMGIIKVVRMFDANEYGNAE
jgi:hypothetical protein